MTTINFLGHHISGVSSQLAETRTRVTRVARLVSPRATRVIREPHVTQTPCTWLFVLL